MNQKNHNQGSVQNPSQDGRMKQNRDQGTNMGSTQGRDNVEQNHQGRVKDPAHDGRLKQNR